MRTAFIQALEELAAKDERIWLLTGDLGFSVLEGFAERFPMRFLNMGVAEQNMTGVAAGLAMSGKTVFTYSIANFPTMRCLEQTRNDVCYHQANVKIVSVGGGFAYGALGYTHHGIEDLAVMRVLPRMRVIAPGDPVETRLATRAVAESKEPCYLRLGKAGEPVVHESEPPFEIGKGIVVREGKDVTLISTGGMLKESLTAADALEARSISVRLVSMHTVKPLDEELIEESAALTRRIVSVEEHGIGGLGSAIGEVVAHRNLDVHFRPLWITGNPVKHASSQATLRAAVGLDAQSIEQAVALMI